ncbi:aldehyde dehydrogenase family protein [Glutamicibacter ardleyensis]|uniref:aldehyde dehydrogenase family protein n=1 Tax=Glutamicibacter ardleyensis TaxID=225894 RepID=UPI003FD12A2C
MQYDNFINGKWVPGEYQANVNPSETTDVIGYYAQATSSDTDRAIQAACNAKHEWGETLAQNRSEVLTHIGEEILKQKNQLGKCIAREEGKLVTEGVGEAERAGRTFLYYAHQLQQATGEMFLSSRERTSIHTVRKPVGTVGIITPWNFPLAIPAWKIAPALAFGNTVVFKPATLVPASAWNLAKIISETNLPHGAFNLVMGSGRAVGDRISKSKSIDAVSFTGSGETGKQIIQDCINIGNKKVQTEMGGKNSLVILDDADIPTAVEAVIDGAYYSAGQRCTATSRVIVTKGIIEEVKTCLVNRTAELTVGHALDSTADLGPLASENQLSNVLEYVKIGVNEGAEILSGGAAFDASTPGFFMQPTLFTGGRSDMRINQEEIFGPVACLIEVDGIDEAIETANDTDYGLCAGIISESPQSVNKFLREVDAGMLHVNRSTALTELNVPFGGTKSSTFGPHEQGAAAREFYTTSSTVYTTTTS